MSAFGRETQEARANRSTNKNSAETFLCGVYGRGDGIILASTGKRNVEVFMRGSMASRTQASARVNRQPRIRRRISKRFGGCGSNPSQQQRPRDDKNAVSGSWSRRRDLRLWRRAPVNSPPGCSVCALLSCCHTIRAQTVCSRKRLHPQIPSMFVKTGKRADESQLSFPWSRRRDLNPRPLGPEPSALPNCATPRTVNIISNRTRFCKRF